MDALEGEELLQLPLGDASVTNAVVPGHTADAPAIGNGAAFTVVVLLAAVTPEHP